MDGEREKLRMKQALDELASLISSLNLGVKKCLLTNMLQLAKEEIVDAKYNMTELVDLNEEWTEPIDVDDWPTPIVKLPQACKYVQLLSNFVMEHPAEFSVGVVMNMRSFMNILNEMSISNINKHHWKTIASHFCSVWYGEDITVGLYSNFLTPYCVTLWAFLSI